MCGHCATIQSVFEKDPCGRGSLLFLCFPQFLLRLLSMQSNRLKLVSRSRKWWQRLRWRMSIKTMQRRPLELFLSYSKWNSMLSHSFWKLNRVKQTPENESWHWRREYNESRVRHPLFLSFYTLCLKSYAAIWFASSKVRHSEERSDKRQWLKKKGRWLVALMIGETGRRRLN